MILWHRGGGSGWVLHRRLRIQVRTQDRTRRSTRIELVTTNTAVNIQTKAEDLPERSAGHGDPEKKRLTTQYTSSTSPVIVGSGTMKSLVVLDHS